MRFNATFTPTPTPTLMPTPTETPQPTPTPEIQRTETPKPDITAAPQPTETPNIVAEAAPTPTPETKSEPLPEVKTITSTEPKAEPSPDKPAENTNLAKVEPTAAPEVKTEDSTAKKVVDSSETATPTVPVQTLKIQETPEIAEKKNDLPTAEPKIEPKPETNNNGQPTSEKPSANSENSAEIIEKNIEIRPRIVHIETEKERKRREKEERELRRQEEKRQSKATDNPPIKSAEQNTNLNENTRNKVVAPSAKIPNSAPKTDAAPENTGFKTLPLSPNTVSENSAATSSAPKNENPSIVDTSCNLRVLQSEVLISSNGGLATLAVDLEGLARPEDLKAKSSDEDDLTIETDGDVGRTARGLRLLFSVKSKTGESGVYTVTFSSPCGKKQVLVKVQKVQ